MLYEYKVRKDKLTLTIIFEVNIMKFYFWSKEQNFDRIAFN